MHEHESISDRFWRSLTDLGSGLTATHIEVSSRWRVPLNHLYAAQTFKPMKSHAPKMATQKKIREEVCFDRLRNEFFEKDLPFLFDECKKLGKDLCDEITDVRRSWSPRSWLEEIK